MVHLTFEDFLFIIVITTCGGLKKSLALHSNQQDPKSSVFYINSLCSRESARKVSASIRDPVQGVWIAEDKSLDQYLKPRIMAYQTGY